MSGDGLDELRQTLTHNRKRLHQCRQTLRRVDAILDEGGRSGGQRRPDAAREGDITQDPQPTE